MPSDLDLLDLQIEALFTHDARGRIVRINEPGGGPAPRFFLGRTAQGNRWRVRADVLEPIAVELAALAEREPVNDDLSAMPMQIDAMRRLLGNAVLAEIGHMGPAYWFPEELPLLMGVTRITRENWHLLTSMPGWSPDVADEFERGEPRFAIVEDGVAVAISASSRLTGRAAEAGVETLPAYRGRGHARQVVLAWAKAVRDSGRIPLYSTSWDNMASQGVARRLDLSMYAVDLSIP